MPDDTIKNTFRLMAGATHTSDPHPYLYYVVRDNDKIVDRRIISNLEEMFLYNNNKEFIETLALADKVNYLGTKKKDTADELLNELAIVSEPWYSIVNEPRTQEMVALTTPVGHAGNQQVSVHTVFAIDKVKLLKQNSKMASVLDLIYRFLEPASGGGTDFVNRLATHRFSITRINKITGKSCFDFLTFSRNEYSSSIFGISFLFIKDQIITYDINIKAIIIPGIIPAINNFAIDS